MNRSRILSLMVLFSLMNGFNSVAKAHGIEIGNGSLIPNAGVEIGNGSFISVPGMFSIQKLVGKWKIDNQFQFVKLINEEKLSPNLEAVFKVYYAPWVKSASSLLEECFFGEWEVVEGLGELNAIQKKIVSKSGEQITQIKIYKKPQQYLFVEVKDDSQDRIFESLKSLNFEN